MNRWWILLPALAIAVTLVLTDEGAAPQAGALSAAVERSAATGRETAQQRSMTTSSAVTAGASKAAKKVAAPIRTLLPRQDLYGPAVASSGKSNLFSSRSWTEPVAASMNNRPVVEEAPPFPYTVAGRKKEGTSWEVFLTRDSEAFVVREGELLERDYRVTKIGSSSMTVVFLRLNHAHEIALGEMD